MDSQISRFSSHDFEESERLSALQDVYAVVEEVDIELIGEGPPSFDVLTRQLGDVGLLDASISPMAPQRTRAQASAGKEDFVLAFITDGYVSFEPANGVSLEIGAGEAYLGINTRASRHRLYGSPKFFDVVIPRSVLLPLVKDVDRVMHDKLPASPESRLLLAYAQMLMRQNQPLETRTALLCADHIRDLAALALGAKGDAAEQAKERGLPHVRLAAIKADIKANLTQQWLSLETLARRHGISPQYLRALFYKDGSSFSEYVRNQRLNHARQMICDPRLKEMRISDIAFVAGFGDLSHFNKAFRSQYGMTPSDARASAIGAESSR